MSNPIKQAIESRVSTNYYDPSRQLSDDDIKVLVAQATRTHTENPGLQRDEAIRSASPAAMTLMLAAEGMGLATGAMIGFDSESLSQEFNLTATELPAIIVTVGYPMPGNWPQKPHRVCMS